MNANGHERPNSRPQREHWPGEASAAPQRGLSLFDPDAGSAECLGQCHLGIRRRLPVERVEVAVQRRQQPDAEAAYPTRCLVAGLVVEIALVGAKPGQADVEAVLAAVKLGSRTT